MNGRNEERVGFMVFFFLLRGQTEESSSWWGPEGGLGASRQYD